MILPKAVNSGRSWREGKMIPIKLRSRHWIVDDKNRIIMGEGRKEILETIEKTGSINQTAKIMRMSYKGAWSKIKATEKYLKSRIVHTDRKEGTRLTKEGRELLEKYTLLKEKCLNEDNRVFNRIFGQENSAKRDR
jgi:molybdate transport system regulatory protein